MVLVFLLATVQQVNNHLRPTKKTNRKATALLKCPQVRGSVARVRILTPKKPNSARRPIAKVKLVNKRRATAHIPGIGHTLKKHSTVLIRGRGARDLPGVQYTCSRGVYDLHGVVGKRRRRSVYGVARPLALRNKLRRKLRKI